MYIFSYVLGTIAITALAYGTILVIRKNKQEAFTTAMGVLGVIVVLTLLKWIF
ncbi:MAG: hypothetical protein Q4C25_03290 [Bacillota bacterium]|nr:hypothetical protein [Bacillota bacterium]